MWYVTKCFNYMKVLSESRRNFLLLSVAVPIFFWLCLCPPYSSEKLYNVYNCGGVFSFALFSAKRKKKSWQVHKMNTLLAWGKFSRGSLESALFQTCYLQSNSIEKSLPYLWAKYFVIVLIILALFSSAHVCHMWHIQYSGHLALILVNRKP